MIKRRPDSPLARLDENQSEELFGLLRCTSYASARKWLAETWGLDVSVSALNRWWQRESRARLRSDFKSAVQASQQFDKDVDAAALDTRANNAIRAAFWQAITTRDTDAIKTLGKLSLDYNVDARNEKRLSRILTAEKRRDEAEAEAARLRDRLAQLEAALLDMGKTSAADPAAVAAELDRHLGVKK